MAWEAGKRDDGTDSKAVQIAPVEHWPSMRALILVVSAAKKDVPSSAGMQATVATSSLFQSRAKEIVPRRMEKMKDAIHSKDFEAFARLTMMDSNSLHACNADTYPPIYYMNDVSRAAVRIVEALNEKAGKTVCAYTFDAGPNAVLYYEDSNAEYIEEAFFSILSNVEGWEGTELVGGEKTPADSKVVALLKDGVSRVIRTRVGEGPISVEDHLD